MSRKSDIWFFDIIKPVAATLIVFHHYQQVFKCVFPGINFYDGFFNFGYFVELFFMISGFLTLYTFKNCAGAAQLAGCFWKKLKRLLPVVTIACLFILVVKTFLYMDSPSDLSALWNIKAVTANFLLLFSGYPFFSMIGYNNPTWYIAILIQCYAVFYLLKYITNKLHIRFLFVCSLFVALAVILNKFSLLYDNSFRGFETFFIGVIICDISENYKAIIQRVKIAQNKKFVSAFLSLVIIIALCSIFFFPKYQRIALVFGIFPETIILSFLYRDVKINSKIRSVFKCLCGVSFEVYIWHYPLMATVQLIFKETGRSLDHTYLTLIVFSIIVWIISFFIYRFLEQPINKLIRTKEKAKSNHEQKFSNNRSVDRKGKRDGIYNSRVCVGCK